MKAAKATMLDPSMTRTTMNRKHKSELEIRKRAVRQADARMWSSLGVKKDSSSGLGCGRFLMEIFCGIALMAQVLTSQFLSVRVISHDAGEDGQNMFN